MAATFAPISQFQSQSMGLDANILPAGSGMPAAQAPAVAPVMPYFPYPVNPPAPAATTAASPVPGPVTSGTSMYQGSRDLSDLTSRAGAAAGASVGGPVGEFVGAVGGKFAGDFVTDLLGSSEKRASEKAMREEIRRREAMQMRQRQEDQANTEFDRNLDLRARYGTAKNYAYNMKLDKANQKFTVAQNFTNTLNNAAQNRNAATDRMVQRGY